MSEVTVLLAGPPPRVMGWYSALMNDARFRVLSFATDPNDFQAKLAARPEVVILDAALFPGPRPLLEALTKVAGVAYVLLPLQADAAVREQVAAIPAVKGVFVGDINLLEAIGEIYAAALARRTQAPDLAWAAREGAPTVAGLRILTVWSQAGGTGKSTVAAALALEAARRGLPTLLVGLGAPDPLPLHLGLEAVPNIMGWAANPTREGLNGALQKVGDLRVLVGFPDVIAEARMMGLRPEDPASLNQLAMTAAYGGFAVVIFDAPPEGLAPMAISASNSLLLVARPTVADAWCSVEAVRTVTERLAGHHRIPPEGILVALNRVRSGGMSAGEWHAAASRALGRSFPPVVAGIPEDPAVEEAQNAGKSPLHASDKFARAIHVLADALLGKGAAAPERRGMFNIRIRLR
ncbi:MAG: cellulose synthase operon protein YhjQ/BcsQ [Armatimonadota bacterium]|nr:cellulose synthase operon protein YhjQ/BcsQ [Armatimonadota bacterium]